MFGFLHHLCVFKTDPKFSVSQANPSQVGSNPAEAIKLGLEQEAENHCLIWM